MKKWYLISGVKQTPTEIVFVEREELKMISEGGTLTSVSRGYDTEQELKVNRNIPEYNCCICKGVIDAGYNNKKELLEHKMCFTCNFFRVVENKANNDKNRVIIEGSSYHISPDNNTEFPLFKGHGGRKFKIKRFDSEEIVESRNVWHQGDIPKEWQERIPDTAEFIH